MCAAPSVKGTDIVSRLREVCCGQTRETKRASALVPCSVQFAPSLSLAPPPAPHLSPKITPTQASTSLAKVPECVLLRINTIFKLARFLMEQNKPLKAHHELMFVSPSFALQLILSRRPPSHHLPHLAHINTTRKIFSVQLRLSDAEQAHLYTCLALLYDQLDFKRKASFFVRRAALIKVQRCQYEQAHQLLVGVADGFSLDRLADYLAGHIVDVNPPPPEV